MESNKKYNESLSDKIGELINSNNLILDVNN